MQEYLAHVDQEDARTQSLYEHLTNVENLAGTFAGAFQAQNLGKLTGRYHDIGKFSEQFQQYIRGERASGGDHSTAGAQFLYNFARKNRLPALFFAAIAIAGHHGGLPDFGTRFDDENASTFCGRMKRKLNAYTAWQEEISLPKQQELCLPEIFKALAKEPKPKAAFSQQFLLRMLFSCLVDADYLDTEAFMNNGKEDRKGFTTIQSLQKKLDDWLQKSFLNPENKGYDRAINQHRRAILQACLQAGDTLDERMMRLTVPTGGGKTIASLAFALHYAARKGLQRVIYVIPYTSIIEQNAKVFANILGSENVVEHHANVEYDENDGKEYRKKLATENWDAPLIVTTNVQFFESLFANRTSRCRKLHNIANSIVIFDEAQMLPLNFLQPCFAAVEELTKQYNCAMLFCTATQPPLEHFLPGWDLQELCPNLPNQFDFFQRVIYQKCDKKLSLSTLADEILQQKQVLCIVNTKKEARELYQLLSDGADDEAEIYHLSTNLCAVHREQVLQRIRERLVNQQPCRVVATSLIEAGVDIDFPVVYREVAGLDSIVQAAGRCNREGKQAKENSPVIVFQLEHSRIAPEMKRAAIATATVMKQYPYDFASPEAIKAYFEMLYILQGEESLDKKQILQLIQQQTLPMPEIAKRFVMIEERTRPVFIPYDERAKQLLEEIKATDGMLSRKLLRQAGRYEVSVYDEPFDKLLATQKIVFLDESNGFAVLQDTSIYDKNTLGLNINVEDGEEIIF